MHVDRLRKRFTAAHFVAEAQETPLSALVVPLVCAVQVWPPLVVRSRFSSLKAKTMSGSAGSTATGPP